MLVRQEPEAADARLHIGNVGDFSQGVDTLLGAGCTPSGQHYTVQTSHHVGSATVVFLQCHSKGQTGLLPLGPEDWVYMNGLQAAEAEVEALSSRGALKACVQPVEHPEGRGRASGKSLL